MHTSLSYVDQFIDDLPRKTVFAPTPPWKTPSRTQLEDLRRAGAPSVLWETRLMSWMPKTKI